MPATSAGMTPERSTLDPSGAQACDLDRRDPGLLGPADAFARDLHVEQVGLTLDRVLAGARERFAKLRRVLHDLAVDAEAFGDRRHVHVRAAEIVVIVLAGLHHPPARDEGDRAAVRS